MRMLVHGTKFLKRSRLLKKPTTFFPVTGSTTSLSVMSKLISIAFHTVFFWSVSVAHTTPASTKLVANPKMPRICRNSSVE